MKILFLKILLVVLVQVTYQVSSCDIEDCGGNGECVNGKCFCNDGFSGEKCEHCTGRFVLTDTNGTFDSTDSGSHFSNCFGVIKPNLSSENSTLHVSFPDIISACYCEYLNVYDGDSVHSPLLATFQGDVLPAQITEVVSNSGMVTLQFPNNDNIFHTPGYEIKYWLEQNDFDNNVNFMSNGSWKSYEWPLSLNKGRAASAMVLVDEKLFVFGGKILGDINSDDIFVSLNLSSLEWETISLKKNSSAPSLKHDLTMVYYNNTLLAYGGMNLDSVITNELWEFNIDQSEWRELKSQENASTQAPPLIGHSSHVTPRNGRDLMLVFFGYHRLWKINPFVFEYDLELQEWRKLNTSGAIPKATYGHASVYDADSNVVYLHGGLNVGLRSDLYMFDVANYSWTILMSSPEQRYLHSMSLLNGNLVVFGGNMDYSGSGMCEPCNVISTLSYNIECSEWSEIRQDILIASSRFGQSVVQFNSSMLVYGGYDGTMNNDIIIYTQPVVEPSNSCLNQNESECLSLIHCGWDGENCTQQICIQNETVTCDEICKRESGSCNRCLSTECSCCFDDITSVCYFNNSYCEGSTCSDESVEYCRQFQDCYTCFESDCNWDYSKNLCGLSENRTDWTCPNTCLDFTKCQDCVSYQQFDCAWCDSSQTCQPLSNQKAFDSYNTCPYFTTKTGQCKADPCSSYESCDSCYKDDRCGWCDLGGNTGYGSCLAGDGHGPLNMSLCPSNGDWKFMKCPECQCNGHSTCSVEEPSVCSNCSEGTTGLLCQVCDQLYFGDSINGDNCSKCECNGHALDCSKTTGKCDCFVKGVTGMNCETCANSLGYFGDAENDTCYYQLSVMTKYSFLLTAPPNEELSQLNFDNCPIRDTSIEVNIQTDDPVDLIIAVNITGGNETVVTSFYNTTYVVYLLEESDFNFGNQKSCVKIYVTNLRATTSFIIWLYQPGPSIGLIIAIFLLSFLSMLILAAIGWRVNIIFTRRRRIRQVIVEREEWAARPFTTIHFEYLKTENDEEEIKEMSHQVGFISEELCSNGKASVYSTFLIMPTAKGDNTSMTTIAIGSCLASSPDHVLKQVSNENDTGGNPRRTNPINCVFSHIPFRRRHPSGGIDNPVFNM